MSESGPGEVCTVCEGALHYVWICIKAQMCCLCGRLIWDVDLFFFFLGRSPRMWMTSLAVVGQGAGPGPPCMVGVLLCMSVSVCPYLRYSLQWPCEGGWLVLVPPTLDPSFYTLAKAKRRSSRHNRKTLVITVGPPQSQRVIT